MFSVICTPKPINWLQDSDLWCFDYTFPDGSKVEDEPLMPEATELINRLLTVKYQKEIFDKEETINEIEITFSSKPFGDYDLHLEYVEPEDDGSRYVVKDNTEYLTMKIWLCPVFDQFFIEKRPKDLYVTVRKIEKEPSDYEMMQAFGTKWHDGL